MMSDTVKRNIIFVQADGLCHISKGVFSVDPTYSSKVLYEKQYNFENKWYRLSWISPKKNMIYKEIENATASR